MPPPLLFPSPPPTPSVASATNSIDALRAAVVIEEKKNAWFAPDVFLKNLTNTKDRAAYKCITDTCADVFATVEMNDSSQFTKCVCQGLSASCLTFPNSRVCEVVTTKDAEEIYCDPETKPLAFEGKSAWSTSIYLAMDPLYRAQPRSCLGEQW